MIEHYNAFISYKHADLDSKIAEHVQHKLEHFRIPAEIKKKLGMKKIERIFRDKEELPITSNLTETITYALEHSDYLIVICTSNTRKSIWVEREIKTFLQTHTRDKILTVLAEGEPYDVIPEILLYEEQVIVGTDGKEVTVKKDLEPLSCDYRIGMRKADRDELPRLACAIIGCGYDELMNRRRQYRTRRLIVVFTLVIAALTVLGSYFYLTRKKIEESLKLAQEKQSRYLAAESERLLNNNQRIKAIQVALMAVPSEENPDIPLIPCAERALVDSVGAYKTATTINVAAVWNYRMPSQIMGFEVSETGKYVAARDVSQNICVWDTGSKKKVIEVSSLTDNIYYMKFAGDDIFIAVSKHAVKAYDLKSQKVLWTFDNEVAHADLEFYSTPILTSDNEALFLPANVNGLYVIDVKTGEITDHRDYIEGKQFSTFFVSTDVSPDHTKMLCLGKTVDDNQEVHSVLTVMNLADNSHVNLAYVDDAEVFNASWIDNDTVVTIILGKNNSKNGYDNSYQVSTTLARVYCCKASTGELLWEQSFNFSDLRSSFDVCNLPEIGAVACAVGREIKIYKISDGQILNQITCDSNIIGMCDRHNNGSLFAMSSSGIATLITKDMEMGQSYQFDLFPDDIYKCAFLEDDIFILQNATVEIDQFNMYVFDPDWHQISDETYYIDDIYIDNSFVDDEYVAFIDHNHGLIVIDADSNKVKHKVDLYTENSEYDFSFNYSIAGRYEDTLYVGYEGFLDTAVFAVNLKSGKCETIFYEEYFSVGNGNLQLNDGKLLYVTPYNGDKDFDLDYPMETLVLLDVTNGKSKSYDIENVDRQSFQTQYLSNANMIVYTDYKNDAYAIPADKGKTKKLELPSDWQGTVYITEDLDGNICLADATRIIFFDKEGKMISTIAGVPGKTLGISFVEGAKKNADTMLVALSTGYLYRYSLKDYSIIGYSKITVNANTAYQATFDMDEENNMLYIKHRNFLDVIELTEWYEVASIRRAIGHCDGNDKFYTYSTEDVPNITIGYFDHYSIDDLIEKAYGIIGDAELSDAEKTALGIAVGG